VVGLVGDGGLSLNLGEVATLAQEKANVTLLIMNDGGYGVMRGIQDKYFGGRQYYNELHTPDFTRWRRRWVCRRGAWIGLRIFRR
jgi:acetolactate synthase-1/2/3 large subunit